MQLLLEHGADVDSRNCAGMYPIPLLFPIGQTALAYCFARLDEPTNLFENKNLCTKMAGLLLDYGADIDAPISVHDGLTLLMQFCGLSVDLSPYQREVNLHIIQLLLEHGADRNKTNRQGRTAYVFSKQSVLSSDIQRLLKETKHIFVHVRHRGTNMTINESAAAVTTMQFTAAPSKPSGVVELELDDTPAKCGCFSWYHR